MREKNRKVVDPRSRKSGRKSKKCIRHFTKYVSSLGVGGCRERLYREVVGGFKQGGLLVPGVLRLSRPPSVHARPLSWILTLCHWPLHHSTVEDSPFPRRKPTTSAKTPAPHPLQLLPHLFLSWPDLLSELFLPIFSTSSPPVLRAGLGLAWVTSSLPQAGLAGTG